MEYFRIYVFITKNKQKNNEMYLSVRSRTRSQGWTKPVPGGPEQRVLNEQTLNEQRVFGFLKGVTRKAF